MTAFFLSASLNSRGPEHVELGVPRGEVSLTIYVIPKLGNRSDEAIKR
jgi:hypothetical protein